MSGYAFVIGLVGVDIKVEGHRQEEGIAEGALVSCNRIKGGEWRPV